MKSSLTQVLDFLFQNEKLTKINRMPKLTIYTCVYNGRQFIAECIRSVLRQKNFREFEYIIIDDASTDDTLEIVKNTVGGMFKNVRIIKNSENVGLAASSNIALDQAKGEYVMRLDADDFFQYQDAASMILGYIVKKGYDAVYCGNQLQTPDKCHHMGGAIFNRKEINFIKFSSKLRGYEGYDFFLRAKVSIGTTSSWEFFVQLMPQTALCS
jgi:glycosyltransferase involved in cell wall biosynthesis